MAEIHTLLDNKTIGIPETRQLDVLANMLTKRGASVVRCPLVAILDAPDPDPIFLWLSQFIESTPDYFILLTGEGFRRLLSFAERAGNKEEFIQAASRVKKITRGPKPGRALKEVGLSSDILADAPTTDGVIQTLEKMDMCNQTVAVQLYGEDPNVKLMDYLAERQAVVSKVAPYIYAPKSSEAKIVELINALINSKIDVMTFTAQSQYKRLIQVAKREGYENKLIDALNATKIAAVGPVIRDTLLAAGIEVEIMPDSSFFMKPMVRKIIEVLDKEKI